METRMTMFSASDVHCQLRASCESAIPAPSHEWNKTLFSNDRSLWEDRSIIPIFTYLSGCNPLSF
jgi:hypothetical protein